MKGLVIWHDPWKTLKWDRSSKKIRKTTARNDQTPSNWKGLLILTSYLWTSYPDFGGRHTGWTFPFSNLRSLESWNISISRVSLTCSIYATAAKTGVTLMQKEYHQCLGGEISLKNCLLFVRVAYEEPNSKRLTNLLPFGHEPFLLKFCFTFIMAISFLVDILCGST